MTIDESTANSRLPDTMAGRAGIGQFLANAIMPALRVGRLRFVLPTGEVVERRAETSGTEATIVFTRWRGLWRILRDGEIGLAQAWIDGDWQTPDLDAVFDFALENLEPVDETNRGWRIANAFNLLSHLRNANTRRGSRRNIATHYDIGNAFYAHWLDDGMNYSSALYRRDDESLEAAQQAKLARAAALLELNGGENVLEIGFGWGAMAEHLAKDHGANVTGLTLSREQLGYARARLAGHHGAADLRFQDYRDVGETYDRIVSLEMVEAVGERYWPVYFDKLRGALKCDGIAVLQAITISEERFAIYRDRPDFIQRYVFPGGMLPTAAIIRQQAARAGLSVVAHEPFGLSYARTLGEWRNRFLAAWPEIEALGFDQRFKRLWTYYLAYCEAGFKAGVVDVGFYKLVPSNERQAQECVTQPPRSSSP